MKLNDSLIIQGLNHINKESDTDLFPKPIEIKILKEVESKVVNELKDQDLGNYKWNPCRRFIIPKLEFSYRIAT